MRRNLVLTITSLLSIVLLSVHLTQDALHAPVGSWAAGQGNFTVILVLSVFLCGTIMLDGRRSGYFIQLLLAVAAMAMPVLHLRGGGIPPGPRPGGTFLFLWAMIALGVLGIFSAILSARGLWNPAAANKISGQQ